MSNEILNIGVTGMSAQGRAMAVIGNNIANNRTVGYKAGTMSFAEAFYPPGGQLPNGVFNQRGQGVATTGVNYNWSTGSIEETGSMTNLALVGDGFLPVQYGGATMYTRAGDFTFAKNPDTTQSNYVLMRPNGAMLMASTDGTVAGLTTLTFNSIPTDMTIDTSGKLRLTGSVTVPPVTSGSDPNLQLNVQRFANSDTLTHVDGGMYYPSAKTLTSTLEIPGISGAAQMRQGSLEQANVDLTKEFSDMIACQRAFQASSRTITTADSMIQEVLGLKR